MPNNSNIVDIIFRYDFDTKEALNELGKLGNNKSIIQLENKIKELEKVVNNAFSRPIKSNAITGEASNILDAVSKVIDRVEKLEVETAASQEQIAKFSDSINQLVQNAGQVALTMTNVGEGFQKASNDIASGMDKIAAEARTLEEAKGHLESLKNTLDTIADGEKIPAPSFEFDEKATKAQAKAVVARMHELETTITDIYGKINSGTATNIDLSNFAKAADEYERIQNKLNSFSPEFYMKNFGKKSDKDGDAFFRVWDQFKDVDNLLDSFNVDDAIARITSRLQEARQTLDKEVSDITGLTTKETAGGGTSQAISIPINISTKASTLRDKARIIIQQASEGLQSEPLEVELSFVSGYQSKKNNALLKEIQANIDSIDDSELKEKFTKLQKGLGQEISLSFNTNFGDTQKEIENGIKAIRDMLKSERFPVYVDPELDDAAKANIAAELSTLTEGIDFNVGKGKSSAGSFDKMVEKSKILTDNLDNVWSAFQKIKENEATIFGSEHEWGSFDSIADIRANLDGVASSLRDIASILHNISGIPTLDEMQQDLLGLGEVDLRKTGVKESIDSIIAKYKTSIKSGSGITLDELFDFSGTAGATSEKAAIDLATKVRSRFENELENVRALPVSLSDNFNLDKLTSEVNEVRASLNSINGIEISGKIENALDSSTAVSKLKVGIEKALNVSVIDRWEGYFLDAINNIVSKLSGGLASAMNSSGQNTDNGVMNSVLASLSEEERAELLKVLDAVNQITEAVNKTTEAFRNEASVIGGTSKEGVAKLAALEKSVKKIGSRIGGFLDLSSSADAFNKIDIDAKIQDIIDSLLVFKEYADDITIDDSSVLTAINNILSKTSELENFVKVLQSVKDTGGSIGSQVSSAVAGGDWNSLLKKFNTTWENAQKQRKNSGTGYSEYFEQQVNKAKEELEAISSGDIIGDSAKYEEISSLMREMSNRENIFASMNSVNALYSKATNFYDTNGNPKELEPLIARLKEASVSAKEAGDSISNINAISLKKMDSQLKGMQGDLREAGKTGKTFAQQIGSAAGTKMAQFLAQWFSIIDIIRYVQQLVSNLKSVDSALVELAKVSDATTTQIESSFAASTKIAKEYGTTLTDVIASMSDWARMGYSLSDSEELAKLTTLMQNVSEDSTTQEDASSYLVSTLQGFEMDVDEAESIIDRYNEVANNFAIDTSGIGEALQRSASSLHTANTDLSESIALVTTANTVVQDPETVGRRYADVKSSYIG